jgi:hypothetical protein
MLPLSSSSADKSLPAPFVNEIKVSCEGGIRNCAYHKSDGSSQTAAATEGKKNDKQQIISHLVMLVGELRAREGERGGKRNNLIHNKALESEMSIQLRMVDVLLALFVVLCPFICLPFLLFPHSRAMSTTK